jgi:hypothetical protein
MGDVIDLAMRAPSGGARAHLTIVARPRQARRLAGMDER